MKKNIYEIPNLECIEIDVEQGFAGSGDEVGGGGEDMGGGW